MTLKFAAGAESHHVNNGYAVAWGSTFEIIHAAVTYSGLKSYYLKAPSSATVTPSANQNQGWWSYANYFTGWGNGTYRVVFEIAYEAGTPAIQRYIGWERPGALLTEGKLTLFGDNAGTVLAQSATIALSTAWNLIKVEFDEGNWTIWHKFGAAAWGNFTYDDTGNFTDNTMGEMRMNPNSSTDEGKGATYNFQYVDDCLMWDDDGNDWNSRIAQRSGAEVFPRISAPHAPITPDSEGGSPEWQNLDELVPDAVALSSITETDYWAGHTDLKAVPEDYQSHAIQAVVVTHAVGTQAGQQGYMDVFNAYDETNTTLYADSADGRVQLGTDGSGTPWWNVAGYYAWTPHATASSRQNWAVGTGSDNCFNDWSFGASIVTDKSDQITTQVIWFDGDASTTDYEWEPPAAGATRRIFIT